MPNWTTNLLTITGESGAIRQCLDAIKGDAPADEKDKTSDIDFEKIIPMPAIVRNTGSGARVFEGDETRYETWFEDHQFPPMSKEREASARPLSADEMAQLEKIGAKNWYDWSIQNWGCKWNATETDLDGNPEYGEVYIRFETPWSPPTPILHALRQQYPALEFSMRYRLEDDPEYPHDADGF